MAAFTGGLIAGSVDRLVRWIVIPITSLIPFLVARGVLLVGFATLWIAFGVALIGDQRAAEQVWEAISDPRNLPHWDRHIALVEGVPATGLREGTRYVTEMKFMGVRAKIRVQVLEWDPPNRAKFQLRGVLEGEVTSTVEPLGPGFGLRQVASRE